MILFDLQNRNIRNIINCLVRKKPPNHYDEEIRAFALTLHSLSPRAYGYIRMKFNNNLPHASTIRTWYASSGANGEPGLSKEALETLKNLVEEKQANTETNNEVLCTLSFDEVNIMRNVKYSDSQKRFIGQISYGSIPSDAEYLPVATNALVFMVNGVNMQFNIPVAYHFINSLQAHEKAALILFVLTALAKIGLKVIGLTFDGLITNIKTCHLLGASLNVGKNFRPHIVDPVNSHKIYIIFDAPHMLKLVRNCIGSYKTLYHENGSKIEWKFYESLVNLVAKCDIVTHKLTKKHILFTKNIMNVKLAAQLCSGSVARSIENFASYQPTKNIFEGSKATADYSRIFNNLFDVCNSATDSNNIFKAPINKNSKQAIFSYLDETSEYILGLKLEPSGKSIIHTKRKTGYLGFIVNIHNIKEMYLEYVESGKMHSLPTRRLNQDPLESFFGRIRTCCLGSNNNPTVEQFCSAYRKVLVSVELSSSVFSNCVDRLSILQVPSTNKPKQIAIPIIVRNGQNNEKTASKSKKFVKSNASAIANVSNLLNPKEDENEQYWFDGSEITVCYLANIIELKVKNVTRTNCVICSKILTDIFEKNEKSHMAHAPTENGRIPSQSTVEIVEIANELLKREAFRISFSYHQLIKSIEQSLEMNNLYANTDFSHNIDHKIDLVQYIIGEFVRERATDIARKITLNEKKQFLRKTNLKLTHQAGQ